MVNVSLYLLNVVANGQGSAHVWPLAGVLLWQVFLKKVIIILMHFIFISVTVWLTVDTVFPFWICEMELWFFFLFFNAFVLNKLFLTWGRKWSLICIIGVLIILICCPLAHLFKYAEVASIMFTDGRRFWWIRRGIYLRLLKTRGVQSKNLILESCFFNWVWCYCSIGQDIKHLTVTMQSGQTLRIENKWHLGGGISQGRKMPSKMVFQYICPILVQQRRVNS